MSENKKPDANLRWVKIGVFVAAIPVLFGFYLYFNQKEEKLIATGKFSKFILPEKTKNGLFKYKSFPSDKIDDILKTIPTKENYLSLYEPRNQILEYIKTVGKPTEESLDTLRAISSFAELEIKNDGLRQAENVTLVFDRKGYYQINVSDPAVYYSQDSDIPVLQEFVNSIPLEIIRPKTSVKLYIWSNTDFTHYGKALVTYTNGAEPIIFDNNYKGYDEPFLIRHGKLILILIFYGLAVLILGIYLGSSKSTQVVPEKKDQSPNVTNETVEVAKEEKADTLKLDKPGENETK